jgi:hypothetical protein
VSGRSGTLLAGDAFAAERYRLGVDLSDYFKAADKTPVCEFLSQESIVLMSAKDPKRTSRDSNFGH